MKNMKQLVLTQLSLIEVRELLEHPEEEVVELARKWLMYHYEIEKGIEERTNILQPAAKLLTIDSQLKYLLEEE